MTARQRGGLRAFDATAAILLAGVVAVACARATDTSAMRTLALDRTTFSLEIGEAVRIVAMGDPDGTVRWASSNADVATVDASGRVVGVSEGATRIWARVGQDSVSAIAVVQAPGAIFAQQPFEVSFDAVSADAELQIVAIGRDPLPEGELADYCESGDPAVVQVVSGPRVVAMGNGDAWVRCRIGHTVDSTAVRVEQRTTGMRIVRSSVRPVRVADSLVLRLARVDRMGQTVTRGTPTWRSLDPGIARVEESTGIVLAVGLGSAPVVAEFEGLVDTVEVEVRQDLEDEPAGLPPLRVVYGDEATTEQVVRAEEPDAGQDGPVIGVDDARLAALLAQQPQIQQSAEMSEPRLRFSALAAFGDHRLDIGFGTEQTVGPMFGAELELAIIRAIRVRAHAFYGTLSADVTGVEDRTTLEFGGVLALRTVPWLDLEVGGTIREYKSDIAKQTWSSLSTGVNVHATALDGRIRGQAGVALLPLVEVSGITESPSLGITGTAGVDYRIGGFTFGVHYDIERYTFPDRLGTQRVEQFSRVKVRVGLAVGGM
jgi:hypothetical protein